MEFMGDHVLFNVKVWYLPDTGVGNIKAVSMLPLTSYLFD